MSNKLPRITAREVIRVLERIYKNEKGVRIAVPYHSGKILHPKLLKSILRDADLSVEEFKRILKKGG